MTDFNGAPAVVSVPSRGPAMVVAAKVPTEQFIPVPGPAGPPGSGSGATKNVKDFGAKGDGVHDDYAAIMAALEEADAEGGGTVYFPAGTYMVSKIVGRTTGILSYVTITCDTHGSARITSSANHPPLGGAWYRGVIHNITLDAANHGSPALNIHMIETVVSDCIMVGWTGSGVRLNDGSYGDIGLLNRFERNHIVQSTGIGVFQTYRWVDSWITGNNIGSTEANLSLEGGPVRVTDNHLNGDPERNIDLRGNLRITISNNILEGARKEAVRYSMPPWLSTDSAQIQLTGNAFSNGSKGAEGVYSAIRLIGVSATAKTFDFSIVGNLFGVGDAGAGWKHIVEATGADAISVAGNQWRTAYRDAKAVHAPDATDLQLFANAGGGL